MHDINKFQIVFNLTNRSRWHFAIVCSVIDTQCDVIRGKNKKVTTKSVLPTNIYLFYIIKPKKEVKQTEAIFKARNVLVANRFFSFCRCQTLQQLVTKAISLSSFAHLGIKSAKFYFFRHFVCKKQTVLM